MLKPQGQIVPIGIVHFDSCQLPIPVPSFHSPFCDERGLPAIMGFEPDEDLGVVFRGETRDCSALVLKDTAIKIVGLADIEGAITS